MSKYAKGIVICWLCFLMIVVGLCLSGSAESSPIEETPTYESIIESIESERETYYELQSLACKVSNQDILDITVTEIQRCNKEIRAYKMMSEITEKDVTYIAKTIGLEARGNTHDQKAMVAWCILNRVDAKYDGQTTIKEVVTAPSQFAYHWWNSAIQEDYDIAREVLLEWCFEKAGLEANRLLPPEYQFFWGDGRINHFTTGVNASGIQFN